MAVMELGSFTNGSTGNHAISLNGLETPTYIDFWVGPRTGTTETANMHSFGAVDITNSNAMFQTNFTDGTSSQTKNGSGSSTGSSCLQHYARVAGVLTKVIDMTFVSVASGTFTINLTTANANYAIYCRIYG